ncbi:MAG: DNA mismatch repair endonuclease MutL [Leptospiraceae bacterium]|nr:DNA mismatch repair endonuclease MutL [Leptospiraceae bacterium]MDW8307187.1 DNA mismatch repair endonuclease MutL [Leptospiraceae bacterium]
MGKIHKLSPLLISQIAAGEVIEGPAEVVKELVENSLDAGASKIEIFCDEAGLKSIQVRDNGEGILKEDLPLALESFATSKLTSFSDMLCLPSFGFRGEALAAIRSVAKITIESRHREENRAWFIEAEQEEISSIKPSSLPCGTRVVVEGLFAKLPVRRQFLKKERFLKRDILDTVINLSLAHPNVHFELYLDKEQSLFLPPAASLTERLRALYGASIEEKIQPVYHKKDGYEVEGYISQYHFYRNSPADIRFFVKKRPIRYRRLLPLLRQIYGELLPSGRFPFCILFLSAEEGEVDFNVHPQKKEVRFRNEEAMLQFLADALKEVVEQRGPYELKQLTPKENLSFYVGASQTFDFLPQFTLEEPPLNEEESPDEKPLVTKKLIVPQKIHAQLFDTFLLCSGEEGILLIDQHTAQERIFYEDFLEKLAAPKPASQELATPIELILSPAENLLLEQNLKDLEALGFVVEFLGVAGYCLRAVPIYVGPGEEAEALQLALRILEKEAPLSSTSLFEQLAKNLACRSAIRKGESLSHQEAEELLWRLFACKTPARCPHGRPTMVFLGREDVFRLFRRAID